MSHDIHIDPLGEHLDLVALTCEWHLPEFDPTGDMNVWLRARTEEARLGGVPCAWVAFDNGEPVGTVSLIESNMDTRRDLTPWLAALFVLPSHRGRGIGAALVERCEREAGLSGASRLYLYSSKAVGYYRRLGWLPVSQEHYEDESVWIMTRDLTTTWPGVHGFSMPRNLVDSFRSDPDEQHRAWMTRLPTIVGELERRWSLEVSEPFQPGGRTAWVAPLRDQQGRELVLKVAWRHNEAEDEAAGLREWDGRGVVRLYEAEEQDDSIALLIERCRPGTSLASRPEEEQDIIIAELLRRLWIEPASERTFRPLQLMCDAWADEFEDRAAAGLSSIDPGLAREGMALFRTLPATADRPVLLCTDLHAENVLEAEREPWLVIDPKPFVGDPTYDPLQHMLNQDRLKTDPVGLTRHMADLVGLSPDRLLLWLFARCVQESPDWPGLAEVARRIAPA